jgi:O-acetyl-ADP-ribose deacetylase (regulator of RNase III)
MVRTVNRTSLELVRGDITEMDTDAIVNAANSHLKHGGGVAGAIVRKGGRIIQEESDRIGRVPVGGAVITGAGALRARHVIHAVGPMMGEGDEDRKLRDATLNSLKLADTHGLDSIAFPAVSTGIFGYPIDRCAGIMLETAIAYLRGDTRLRRVVFCLFDEAALRVFSLALEQQMGR